MRRPKVFVSGCFDLLHPGHVSLREAARAEGDRLLVGLNSDTSVRGSTSQPSARSWSRQAARSSTM